MNPFQTFAKNIKDSFSQKSFTGMISNHLPASDREWGADTFINAVNQSIYVNRAINIRAKKVGEVEFVLEDTDGETIEDDSSLELLNQPNNIYTGFDFWELYQKYYDLTGEAYIYIESKRDQIRSIEDVQGLHLLPSNKVEAKFNKDGTINKFIYKKGNGQTEYEADEVIYIFNPDPQKPLHGKSLLKPGIDSIQADADISEYHSRLIENGGKPEGVFSFKEDSMSLEKLKNLKENYKKEYAKAKNSGVPMFLSGDAKYEDTGLTPKEMDFLKTKEMILKDISILTGVPEAVLGSYNDIKYSNAEISNRAFMRDTIVPLMRKLTTNLNKKLFSDTDKTLTFIDPTPENAEERRKDIENGIQNYFMTVNEAREEQGLDPVDDGNDILTPMNRMPLSKAQDIDPTNASGAQQNSYKKKVKTLYPEGDGREEYIKQFNKNIDDKKDKMKDVVVEYNEGLIERVIERQEEMQMSPSNIANREDELNKAVNKFTPVMKEMFMESGDEELEDIEDRFQDSYSKQFRTPEQYMRELEKRAEFFVGSMLDTNFQDMKGMIIKAMEEGVGVDELARRLRDYFDDFTLARANTIARTETGRLVSQATQAAYEQSDVVQQNEWLTAQDDRVRAGHQANNGAIVPVGDPFPNGERYPGDNSINCRCALAPAIE